MEKCLLKPYWPLIIPSVIIAISWTIYCLIVGSVPTITSLMLGKDALWPYDRIYVLPFGISHWWDVFRGLILSLLISSIFKKNMTSEEEKTVALLGSFILGLASMLLGSLGGLIEGLIVASIIFFIGMILRFIAHLFAGDRNFSKTWFFAQGTALGIFVGANIGFGFWF